MLHLSFTQGSPNVTSNHGATRTYGTSTTRGTTAPTTLSVMAGQQVILQQSSGRDYQLQASQYGWAWTQVQQVPRNMTYIAVTPTLMEGQVQLQIDYSQVEGDQAVSYSSTAQGPLGQWIPLLQAGDTSNLGSATRYSTRSVSQQLSVKVEQAR